MDEAEIAARLRLSATRLARRLRQESTTTGHSPSQLSALAAVFHNGPLTLGELAEYERVSPPTVTKVAAKLEADGLIQRTADPADGRVSRVSVTKTGRALILKTRERKTTWLRARVTDLSPADQARLADALDVLDELAR